MDKIPIGQQVTKTLKFRKPYPQFSLAPNWDITNNDTDTTILSGTAVISGTATDAWDVVFTIPTSYRPESGNDILILELYGTDINGKVRSTEMQFGLIDAADDFLPSVVTAMDDEIIEDSFILEYDNVTAESITVDIQDYRGVILVKGLHPDIAEVFRVANKSDVPDRFTEHEYRGFRYDIEIPAQQFPAVTRAPYQIIYKIRSTTPKVKTVEMHPLIPMRPQMINMVSRAKMYLDRARLVEIDPTLQFREDDLALAVIAAIDHVNAHPTVYTYWTIEDLPLPIHSIVEKATCFYELNRRYIAEGMNAFEFQGLTTSLNMDRREALTYKIEELKAYLDTNLTLMKANAISSVGKGIPDASVTTRESRVLLRTQPSPVHNRYGYGGGTFGAQSLLRGSRRFY